MPINPEYAHIDENLLTQDIFKRHRWLPKSVGNHLKLFIQDRKEVNFGNPSFHPDALVADLLDDIQKNYNRYFKKDDYRTKSFFKISKNAVATWADFETVNILTNSRFINPMILRTLVFYSLVPTSWSKQWNNVEDLSLANYVSNILYFPSVQSSEDLLDKLKPYKGDLFKIFSKTSEEILSGESSNIETFRKTELSGYYNCEKLVLEIKDLENDCMQTIVEPLLLLAHRDEANPQFKAHLLKKLLGEKSLYKLSLKSKIWHENVDTFSRAKASLKKDGGLRWTALTSSYIASNGLRLEFLTSSTDLIEEGSRSPDRKGVPGLCHCVGSYANKCHEGRAHILSVRKISEYGAYSRLSTVEFEYNSFRGKIYPIQHYGPYNGRPTAEAHFAVNEFIDNFNSSKIGINHMVKTTDRSITENNWEKKHKELEYLYVLWKPLLAKKYKDMSIKALVEEVKMEYENETNKDKPKQLEWSDIVNFFKKAFNTRKTQRLQKQGS